MRGEFKVNMSSSSSAVMSRQMRVCGSACFTTEGNWQSGSTQCLAKEKLEAALLKYFKYTTFRPGQLDALLAVMHGKDVLVRMATGAGKSLCMFLAPLALSETAVGVIISPLNCLMEQQVRRITTVNQLYCPLKFSACFSPV